jgi:hypothetical protein
MTLSTVTLGDALPASLRGVVIRPDHADYEAACTVYNAMIDRRPALIARCGDVADVIAAVHFGRDQGLLIAVRGGGPSGRPLSPPRSGPPARGRRTAAYRRTGTAATCALASAPLASGPRRGSVAEPGHR